MPTMLRVEDVAKTFVLHNQGGAELRVLANVSFEVSKGEAVMLSGPSGAGKSTLLRILFANYRPTSGRVWVRHGPDLLDIASAPARVVLDVRRRTLGWVSQFLRVIPRVSTLDLVAEPMLARGLDRATAERRAAAMLERVNLPSRLWRLAPQTFSGGEQQRVNIARSFVDPPAILLLDEPTASLDTANRDTVVDLVNQARREEATVVGVVHDEAVRARIATRGLDIGRFRPATEAATP